MQTTNKDGDLAIAVCPQCNLHSVCDPAWLGIEGETLGICCDNCGGDDEETPHLIVRFTQANAKVEARVIRPDKTIILHNECHIR